MDRVQRRRNSIRMGWFGLWRGVAIATAFIVMAFGVRGALQFAAPPPWEGGYLLVGIGLVVGTVILLVAIPLIGGLVALLLELLLRRVTDWRWHLAAFATIGLILGATPTLLTFASWRSAGLEIGPATAGGFIAAGMANALIFAVASALGWLAAWLLWRRSGLAPAPTPRTSA